eukprot:696405-Alexandrium_andersonii.AAC.1
MDRGRDGLARLAGTLAATGAGLCRAEVGRVRQAGRDARSRPAHDRDRHGWADQTLPLGLGL